MHIEKDDDDSTEVQVRNHGKIMIKLPECQ